MDNIYQKITRDKWDIGFVEGGIDAVMQEGHFKTNWLRHNDKNCWFADPFILDVTESEIVVLVEEFQYVTKKGRIAELIIDNKTYELKDKSTLLELDTHLSFPAILRDKDRVFIYPESWQSGRLSLYEYKGRGEKLEFVKVLCDESMADAVMTDRFDKKPLLFSTKKEAILSIYNYDVVSDTFVFSKELNFGKSTARNAGDFYEYHGEVFRPAQVGDHCYGEAVEIQKVVEDSDGNLCFEPYKTLLSNHPTLRTGMHTLNSYKGVAVVDVHGWEHPKIIALWKVVKNSTLGKILRQNRKG